MMLWLTCPNCGRRPVEEFVFGGEVRAESDPILEPDEQDIDLVWMFDNPDGLTTERWFHVAGCGRWTTIRRDTSIDVEVS